MNSLFASVLIALFVLTLYAIFLVYKKEGFTLQTTRPRGFQGINTGAPILETYSGQVYTSCKK